MAFFENKTNDPPFLSYMQTGAPFELSYSNGLITCSRARSATLLALSICALFGPGMMVLFYLDDRAVPFDAMPTMEKTAVIVVNLVAWGGILSAFFYSERIVFDCVERRVLFFKNSRIVHSIEPGEIGSFELKERLLGVRRLYEIQLIRPDGSVAPIVQSPKKVRGDELMELLRTYFLKGS